MIANLLDLLDASAWAEDLAGIQKQGPGFWRTKPAEGQ